MARLCNHSHKKNTMLLGGNPPRLNFHHIYMNLTTEIASNGLWILNEVTYKETTNLQTLISLLLIHLHRCTLEMQVFFPLLKLSQTLSTSCHTNLPIRIVWRLENALPLPSREETNLQIWMYINHH